MNTAIELGPWEPGVQRVFINIGLHGWPMFDVWMQGSILETINKAIIHSDKKHVNSIINTLKNYNMLDYACLSVKEDAYIQRVCKK